MDKIRDFPKLESPFVRKEINGDYIVTPEINPDCKWVFEDESVLAVEKLHGTNVSLVIEDKVITSIYNRTERIPFFNKGKIWIVEGVIEAFKRGYCDLPDGQHFGELIGPRVNGNPYNLDKPVWIPFATYAKNHLAYKSWGKYPKDFETISNWFKELMPLYYWRKHGREAPNPYVEGAVFTHPDGRMCKLRKDMFSWASEQGIKQHKEGDGNESV